MTLGPPTAPGAPDVHLDPPVTEGRFRAERVLDEGDGVLTRLATDLVTGEAVVLRSARLEEVSATALEQLMEAARALRGQPSPGLVPLRAVGRSERLAWTVHPFVPGPDLASALRDRGPLGVVEAVRLGRSLAGALDRLHAEGRLHRGVRPSHVVLPDDRSAPVLLPFGLAGAWRDAGAAGRNAGPSLGFMPPEQAGLRAEPEDARTDLYGLGAVLFAALSGRAPFDRVDPAARLRDMLLRPAPALRRLGVRLPRALEALIERLLQKDPRDRYQTAAGVAHDLEALQRALAQGETDPPLVIGTADRRKSLTRADFTGRRSTLRAFDGAVARLRDGGGLWVQCAPDGGGLSRSLEEEARRAAAAGVWVLEVPAEAGDAPGAWLARLAQQVADGLRGALDRAEVFRAALGDEAARVRVAFPALANLLHAAAPAPAGPPFPAGPGTPGAVLVAALAAGGRPTALLIDDGRHLDRSATAALAQGLSGTAAASGTGVGVGAAAGARAGSATRGALLVVINLDDDAPAQHPVRALPGARHLHLEPLSRAETVDLIGSMAGPLPPPVVERVLRLAGGSPFTTRAALIGLVESGALTADDEGWRLVDPEAADRSSAAAAARLTDRLHRLEGAELQWLTAGALLGGEFRTALAGRLAELDARSTRQAAAAAARHHFIWRQGARCSFVHPGVRAALVDRLAAAERRALHLRAAELLRSQPGAAAELARHLAAAGEGRAALAPALAASAEAAEQGDLGRMAELLAVALAALEGDGDRALRRRLLRDRGHALTVLGRSAEARDLLDRALAASQTPLERAEVLGIIGELAYRLGSPAEAYDHLVHALTVLGRPVAQGRGARALGLGQALARHTLHALAPARLKGQRGPEQTEIDRLAGHLMRRLSYAGFFSGGPLEMLHAHLEHLNLMEQYAPTEGLAAGYADHALLLTEVLGAGPLAQRYARRSLRIRQSLGSAQGRGESGWFLGLVLLEAGQLAEALEVLRTAVPTLRRVGDRWEADMAHFGLLRVRLARGELRVAREEAQRLRREAEARGGVATRVRAALVEALATGGALPPDVLDGLDEANIPEPLVRFALAYTRALMSLAEGRPAEAAERLDATLADARRCGLALNATVRPMLIHRVQAHRRAAELASPYDPEGAAHQRQRAHAALREARVLCYQRPLQASGILRERGLLAALDGRGETARQHLEAAFEVAERYGLRTEAAAAAAALAAVGAARNWRDVVVLRARAQRLSAALPAPDDPRADRGRSPNPALADRFAGVLVAGRRLAASLSVPAVHLAAHDAARSLLRAERALVVPLDRGLVPAPEHLPPGVDAALLRRALLSRGVVRSDAQAAEVAAASVLCAPILARGRPAALLYAELPAGAGAFGAEEAALAEFITSLAGTALDNAAGFEAVKNLGRALEERTVELVGRNEELLATQEELEAFSYSVAHDLRGGLLAVNGYASALQEDYGATLDEVGQHFLERLQRTAVRLGGLTASLMVLSGVSRSEMRREVVDLSVMAHEVVADLQARFSHPIRWHLAPDLRAEGDPDMLRSVLQNLLENAAKFTRDAADPEVRFEREGEGYRVHDNGAGFDMRYADKLFRPFQRLHDAHDFAGTGVGLATVRRVIRRHGGEISATSSPGAGTTFRFTLGAG